MLGRRFEATEGFRERSGRDALGRYFSVIGFRGSGSAKLGSVSSRISDRGRILAQEDALMECPLGSPKSLLTMPPHPPTRLVSDLGDARNDVVLTLSNEGQDSDEGLFAGDGFE
jgi:hypothetical protein